MIHMRHMIPMILVEHMIEMVHDVHMQILPKQWKNPTKPLCLSPQILRMSVMHMIHM